MGNIVPWLWWPRRRYLEVSSANRDRLVLQHTEDNRTSDSRHHGRILRLLSQSLEPTIIEMWFDQGRSIVVKPQRVQIRADNEFHLSRLQNRYARVIRQAVDDTLGPSVPIDYHLASAPSTVVETKQGFRSRVDTGYRLTGAGSITPSPSKPANQNADSHRDRPKRGVDSFWFGETNRLAQAGIMQMFQQLGQISPIVLYGPAGSGKTHLLESLVVDARRKHKKSRCVFLSAEQFTANFVQALRGTGLPVFRRKYRDLDVLAVDDVHFFAGKNATLAEFQHTIDNLSRHGKQVILTSDRPPIDLGKLGSDLTARMMSGLVCPLNYPDAAGRAKIVREMCRQRNVKLPNDVVELISHNLARDVRRLSGAINRIHAISIALNKQVDLELARQALTDLFSINGNITSLGSIEKVVCEFCGVKPVELKSNSRHKRICTARMLAMYLARKYTPNAYSEIGEYFGRSHSTVIAAHKKVSSWVVDNEPLDLPHARYPARDAVVQIESSLRIG